MRAIIVSQRTWDKLPYDIMREIIETAKKDYGVKFISRETKEEIDEDGTRGLFLFVVKELLDTVATYGE